MALWLSHYEVPQKYEGVGTQSALLLTFLVEMLIILNSPGVQLKLYLYVGHLDGSRVLCLRAHGKHSPFTYGRVMAEYRGINSQLPYKINACSTNNIFYVVSNRTEQRVFWYEITK